MTTKNIQPIEDFNWDALGKKENSFDGVSREELEKKYGETFSQIQEGTVVEGTVVAITKREVVVNIGYKSEGVINAAEFRYETDLKVGDKVVFTDMAISTMVKNNTFNGRPLPAITVKEGDGIRVIREFGYEDFVRRL